MNPRRYRPAKTTGRLSDSYLNSSLDCIQIDYLDGEQIALVVAQVAPTTKWARIAHTGLLPSARSRGLGAWVHRHGIPMLEAQGGKTHQGGTSTFNSRMISLFQKHGCKEFERYEDWVWRAAPPETEGTA